MCEKDVEVPHHEDAATASCDPENWRVLADLSYRQLMALDGASDAIDQKAGVLLGFHAVVLALGLQMLFSPAKGPLESFFGYVAALMLLISIAVLILVIVPQARRTVPDVGKLVDQCWRKKADFTLRETTLHLKEAWLVNSRVHSRKASLLSWALWIGFSGILVLAFTLAVLPALTS